VNKAAASIRVNGVQTASGTASAGIALTDGSSTPISIVVTAEDGVTQKTYTVNVTRAAENSKEITSFVFRKADNPTILHDFAGVIHAATHTIGVNVANGTDLVGLKPTLEITGISVSPASGLSQNFSSQVTYTVMAGNSSQQAYEVTVSVLPLATVSGTVTLDPFDAGAITKPSQVTIHNSDSSFTQTISLAWNGSTATYAFTQLIPEGIYTISVLIDMNGGGRSNGDYYGVSSGISVNWDSGTVTRDCTVTVVNTVVSGTITIPPGAGATGKTAVVVLLDRFNTSGGMYTFAWGSGNSETFTISNASAGKYFLLSFIDIDGSGTVNSGDRVGYWGGTGVFPPSPENITLGVGDNISDLIVSLSLQPLATATVNGTLTAPDSVPAGRVYRVYIVPAGDLTSVSLNLNGYAGRIDGIWSATGNSQSFSVPNVFPGNFYVCAIIDYNGNGLGIGDYFGWRGGSGDNPPSAPVVSISEGEIINGIDFSISGSYH
jgi:uncharacterized protein (DUF2141 family)